MTGDFVEPETITMPDVIPRETMTAADRPDPTPPADAPEPPEELWGLWNRRYRRWSDFANRTAIFASESEAASASEPCGPNLAPALIGVHPRHRDEATQARRERDMIREILPAIHGDGGHYTEEHGVKKSVEDAIAIIYRDRSERAEARSDAERLRGVIQRAVGHATGDADGEIDWATVDDLLAESIGRLEDALDERAGRMVKAEADAERLLRERDAYRDDAERARRERDEARALADTLQAASDRWMNDALAAAEAVQEGDALIDRLRDVLRAVEWSGDTRTKVCPSCRAGLGVDDPDGDHRPDCPLAAALAGPGEEV